MACRRVPIPPYLVFDSRTPICYHDSRCRGTRRDDPFAFLKRRTTDGSNERDGIDHRDSDTRGGGALRADVVRQVSVPGEACVYFAGQSQPALQSAYPPDSNWAADPWDFGSAPNHTNFHNDTAPWDGVVRATANSCTNASSATGRVAASTVPPCIFVGDLQGTTISITATGRWGRGPCDPNPSDPGIGPEGWAGNTGTAHAEYDDLGIRAPNNQV